MGWWTERVLPRCVDRALSSEPVRELRREVCAGLSGRVLEIGFGSGLNVDHYPTAVTSLDAVEPADLAWRLSEGRRGRSPVPMERVGLDGERLPLGDATYDAVLSTFTLCTIPDVATALAEVRRVLRPGGALHFLEHGLAPDAGVARWQRRLDPVQGFVAGGCHLTRDIPALILDAGLRVEHLEQAYVTGPAVARPWSFGSLGVAVKP